MIIEDTKELEKLISTNACVVFFVRDDDENWKNKDLAEGIENKTWPMLGLTYYFSEGDFWEQCLDLPSLGSIAAFSKGKLLHQVRGQVPFSTIWVSEAAMAMIYEIKKEETYSAGYKIFGEPLFIDYVFENVGIPYESMKSDDVEKHIKKGGRFESF